MTYFNRGGGSDRGGFGGGRSSGRSFGGNDRGDRPQLFSAVCDQCGKNCEVPFRPNGSKPIYCSSCFETKNGGSSDRGGDRGSFRDNRGGNDRGGFGGNDRGEDRTTVRRFEKDGRPIENNFEKEAKLQARHADELANINLKLDKLINLLTPKTETAKEEVVVKKAKKVKKVEEVTE